jgi:hypothetical protein
MLMATEKIWYRDIKNFITSKNALAFFPDESMTFAEQLNSLLRFSMYFSLIVLLIRKNVNILLFPLFMSGFTYCLYAYDKQTRDTFNQSTQGKGSYAVDKKDGSRCISPSSSNPFMNVLMTDYADRPDRPKACDLSSLGTKKVAKQMFNHNLYRDVDDIFHKKASDRQFYTNAITTIPNDSRSFAEWCYGHGPTCKEGNGNRCFSNTHMRHVKN